MSSSKISKKNCQKRSKQHKLGEEKRPRRALEWCDVLLAAPPPTPGVPMTSFSQASPTPELMVKVSPPACQRVFEKVKQGQKGGTGSPWVAGWTRCPPRIHRLASCNASATTSPLLDAINSFFNMNSKDDLMPIFFYSVTPQLDRLEVNE